MRNDLDRWRKTEKGRARKNSPENAKDNLSAGRCLGCAWKKLGNAMGQEEDLTCMQDFAGVQFKTRAKILVEIFMLHLLPLYIQLRYYVYTDFKTVIGKMRR